MGFLAPALPFVGPALDLGSTLFGKKGGRLAGGPSGGQSTATPTLFGPGQVRTPTRTRALEKTTPSLVEKGLQGPDLREGQRLRTRAFEDIGLSTKSALGNLRETFGRSGVRGGVQGSDVSDILEAAIAAQGQASTSIEDILKGDEQNAIRNLLQLLGQHEPFAVANTGRASQTGARKSFAESGGVGNIEEIIKSIIEFL